jgi:hypothetical protein
MLANPNITKNDITKSLIEGNPRLNHDVITHSVDMAFLETSNYEEKPIQQDKQLDKMEINDNEVSYKTHHEYKKKNTMKYLKGDLMLIPDEYSEPEMLLMENVNGSPNLLTESCTQKHIQNFNCNNIPKNTNDNFNGYEYDFDNNGTF